MLNCAQVGEESTLKTFLIDVKWGDLYPDELPHISLDAFYNKLVYVIFALASVVVLIVLYSWLYWYYSYVLSTYFFSTYI